jgi:tetratricopeptide (TPR) repeat protein
MTGTGGLVGTPAYMAPEQARGQEVDARCDQFSFCVALYEALAGTRPFPGDDLPAVLARIERGELAPPRERPPVPGRVMRALRRGLAAAPAARFPSMDALLDALAPSRGRRVALGAAAAVTLAVAAVGGARLLAPAPAGPAPCTGFEALLGGVWDAPRRARVEARFGASEQAFAAEAFTRAAGRLDAYAAAWVRARGEACAATRVRGDQSEALLDARVRCLDGRRAELDRAAWVLEHADAPTMSRAVDVAAGLTDLERCADARALAQRLPPPRDPLARAKITAVEARLAEVKALLEARDWGHAVALSEPLLADAEALTWPPLVASALYHHAGALQGIGRYQEAAALYERAALTAERAGDDRLRFLALVYQADTRGYFLSDRPAATRLEREARALLERLDDDPELRAILLERLANIELHFGDLDRAKALALEQLELRRDRLGADDLVLARAYLLVGRVLEIRNELDEAERHLLRAQELFARVFGAEHPGLTSIWHALAIVYKERGELVKAEALQKKIIAVEVPLWGADNDKIGRTMHNLGATLRLLGKHDESRLVLERSLAIKIAVDGEDGLWTATTRTNLAETLLELGRFDEAAAQLERARDSEARHTDRGPSPYTTALLGVAEVRRGHRTKGLELLDAAVAAARRQVAEPLELAAALALRGPVLLDLGRAAAARADLEEALAILQRGPAPPQDHAELEFGLARALDASGGDRRRAVALARRALERLEHADAPDAKREAIRRWLATR